MTAVPNEADIRSTWRWLAHGAHGVSEVRAIRPGAGIQGIGFFDDEEAFVRECLRANATANVYVGIQPRPAAFAERARNVLRPLRNGAGKADIRWVTAMVIDLDPVRPKDTASTDAELGLALDAARSLVTHCEAERLRPPVLLMSGNGAQLWFALPPIELDAAGERVQRGLKAFEAELRARVSDARVNVDSIHDVARIIKVAGTVSHKGEHTLERPHRTARPLSPFERYEDSVLRSRLFDLGNGFTRGNAGPPAPPRPLPVLAPSPAADGLVRRDADGRIHWPEPVSMCGPIRSLWEKGHADRSVAIFNMVRFFAHKGLGLEDVTTLVLEYDRRILGKLKDRDGQAYVRHAYEKVIVTRHADGTVVPPCHGLQKLALCPVNRAPEARCDVYERLFDVRRAIEALPEDLPVRDAERRLSPILESLARQAPAKQSEALDRLAARTGLPVRDLRRSMARYENDDRDGDEVEPLDGGIYEDARCYYALTARGEAKVISSFTMQLKLRLKTEQGELLIVDARSTGGITHSDLRLPVSAFHSKRDLLRHLPGPDLQWTGSDNNVQGLLQLLTRRTVPTRETTAMLGLHELDGGHVWLGPDAAITREGVTDQSALVFVSRGGTLDRRLCLRAVEQAAFDEVARVVFAELPRLHEPGVVIPMLGWFFAAPLKPLVMEVVGSFPILCVWGTQGSGKSTLCSSVFWPLAGFADTEPYSATETEFALVKLLTSTNAVPVVIDEYKPYDMPKQRLNMLHRLLRRIYRGEVEERGRPDLTVATFHLQAPVCVAGETRPSEPALVERLLVANPDKTALERNPGYVEALDRLRAVDLTAFTARYVAFCLGRDVAADLRLARAATQRLLGPRQVPLRVLDNLACMVFGVHLFEEFAKACGMTMSSELRVGEAVDAMLTDVLGEESVVRSALDQFLETLGVMAIQGELRPRVHYVVEDGMLCVHLESAYDQFRQHCKRIAYDGDLVDLRALRRQVRENKQRGGYVASETDRICFNGRNDRRRSLVIDLARTDLVEAGMFSGASIEASRRSWEPAE